MPYLTDMFHDQNRTRVKVAEPADAPADEGDPTMLSHRLNACIVGQRPAIDAVVRAVSLARVGAHDPTRPLAMNRLGFLAAPISVTAPVVESTGERSTPPRIHPAGRIRDGCAGDCD